MLKFVLLFLMLLAPLNASAETIEVSSPKINLIEMSDKLNEYYRIDKDSCSFSFNGNILGFKKDSPFFELNGEKHLFETESVNGVILPKYKTISISGYNVEFDYDKFIDLTGYKTSNKGIEVEDVEEYNPPEADEITELTNDYVKEHIHELGYQKLDGSNFRYVIDGRTYQNVTINDNIKITCYLGEDYEKNIGISNLLVKTLLKATNNEDVYDEFLTRSDYSNEEVNMKNNGDTFEIIIKEKNKKEA